MLEDDKENIRNGGVTKMLAHRKQVAEESANNGDCSHAPHISLIRLFDVPTLNLEANTYYKLPNFDLYQQQPPATASLATIPAIV